MDANEKQNRMEARQQFIFSTKINKLTQRISIHAFTKLLIKLHFIHQHDKLNETNLQGVTVMLVICVSQILLCMESQVIYFCKLL